MPLTDFNVVYPNQNDMPSQIDVFNDDSVQNQLQERAEYLKQLSEGLSAADLHTFGATDVDKEQPKENTDEKTE